MPKGFDLRCAAGKTAHVWQQGKGGGLKPGQAFVLFQRRRGRAQTQWPDIWRRCGRRSLTTTADT